MAHSFRPGLVCWTGIDAAVVGSTSSHLGSPMPLSSFDYCSQHR